MSIEWRHSHSQMICTRCPLIFEDYKLSANPTWQPLPRQLVEEPQCFEEAEHLHDSKQSEYAEQFEVLKVVGAFDVSDVDDGDDESEWNRGHEVDEEPRSKVPG